MQRKAILVALVALATSVGGLTAANAAPIVGGIMFSDTFATSDLAGSTSSIVSGLTTIPVDPPELAQGCTGTFATGGACIPNSGTFAVSFVINNPIAVQPIFTYNGFSFTMTGLVGSITRGGLTCSNAICTDSLSFDAVGSVMNGGGDLGSTLMHWQADASCAQNVTGAPTCQSGTATGHWLATVAATASSTVPEPGTLALLGVSLGLLGFALRRPAK